MKISRKNLASMAEKAGIKLAPGKEQEYRDRLIAVEAVVKQNEKILSTLVNSDDSSLNKSISLVLEQNNGIMKMLSHAMKPEEAMNSVAKVIHSLKNTRTRTITGKVINRDINGLMTDFKLEID